LVRIWLAGGKLSYMAAARLEAAPLPLSVLSEDENLFQLLTIARKLLVDPLRQS
jgi:hypothetical protein